MTATAPEDYRPTVGETRRPSDEVIRSLDLVRDVALSEVALSIGGFVIVEGNQFVSPLGSTPERETSPLSPIRFKRDEHGELLAWDVVGVAYGSGANPADATADWEAEAREAYDDLREHEDRLHPRLVRQLEFLRTYFG